LQKELKEGKTEPYDSHPNLAVRLAALHGAPHTPPMVPDPPAIDLLNDVPALEAEVLRFMTQKEIGLYAPGDWEHVTDLWLEHWYEDCRIQRHVLEGMTVRSLPDIAVDVNAYASRVRTSNPRGSRVRVLIGAVGEALTLVLVRRGWTVSAPPGELVTARWGDD